MTAEKAYHKSHPVIPKREQSERARKDGLLWIKPQFFVLSTKAPS